MYLNDVHEFGSSATRGEHELARRELIEHGHAREGELDILDHGSADHGPHQDRRSGDSIER
jgi:hypothetical protein